MFSKAEITRTIAAIAIAGYLVACQSSPNNGPDIYDFAIPEYTKTGFVEYRRLSVPLFFAVSPDGVYYGYTFCEEGHFCDDGTAQQSAINLCNRRSPMPCRTFAKGRSIVASPRDFWPINQ